MAVSPPSPSRKTVAFIGDEQIHIMPYVAGAYRSLLVDRFAPGLRLPMSNLGVFSATETLLRQALTPEVRERFQGFVSMGDTTDVATTEELEAFFRLAGGMARDLPALRLRLFPIGNHELLYSGQTISGPEGVLLSWLLALGGDEGRNLQDDIHGPEAGARVQILTKRKVIEMAVQNLYGRAPRPVILRSSDGEFYMGKGVKGSWNELGSVFHQFWRRERNAGWVAEVRFEGEERRELPEEQDLFVSATRLDPVQTSKGPVPIYVIGIDFESGSLESRISREQVALAEAFIYGIKEEEPGALFILDHHYPIHRTSILGLSSIPVLGSMFLKGFSLEESVLKPLLSDESVVAVVSAHVHHRGFVENLCAPVQHASGIVTEPYCPATRSPLPEVTVPAVIDYPNEMVLLHYGVEDEDPNKLVLDFEFRGIDESQIPGTGPDVAAARAELYPRLLIFEQAFRHIRDPRFVILADRFSSFWQKLDLLINIDRGILWGPEEGNDEIIVNDVIPAQVAAVQLVMRAVLADIQLTLRQEGLTEEARRLEAAFLTAFARLDQYYEDISSGRFVGISGSHHGAHETLSQLTAALSPVGDLLERLATRAESLPPTSAGHRDLETMHHLAEGLYRWTESFREWLIHYEENRRLNARAHRMIDESNLFGKPGFRVIWNHLPEVRYGSPAAALHALLFLDSSKLRFRYRGEEKDGSIPENYFEGKQGLTVGDQVRLEVDLKERTRRVVHTPLSREEVARRLSWWSRSHRVTQKTIDVPLRRRLTDMIQGRGIHHHWQGFVGFSLGRGETLGDAASANPFAPSGGNRGIMLTAGIQAHLLNDWRLPRLNGAARAGVEGNWQARSFESQFGPALRETFHLEFPARAALTLGDPWGYVEAGGLLGGGFAYRADDQREGRSLKPFWGYGIPIGFLEGSVLVEGMKRFYVGGPREWNFSVNVDLLRFPGISDEIGHTAPRYLPRATQSNR